jgi:predicted nucleic acid-binding Zn ribbon protein
MGYDKPDLSFVVHFQSPGSPVAYYQQVGRAGRALETSRGILLRGVEDEQIQDYFIEQAFAAEAPRQRHRAGVRLRSTVPVPLMRIQVKLNVRIGVLELVVKQLDVDGALERVGGTSYQRTLQPWTYPASRVEAVTAARRARAAVDGRLLPHHRLPDAFIANLLDDPVADDCGICDNCTGAVTATSRRARRRGRDSSCASGRSRSLAKKMYLDPESTGEPQEDPRRRTGRGRPVLSMWGDAGWGQLVREGKTVDGRFDDRTGRGARRTGRAVGARPGAAMGHVGPLAAPPGAGRRGSRNGSPPGSGCRTTRSWPGSRNGPSSGTSRTRPISNANVAARSASPAAVPTHPCCSSTMSSTRAGRSPRSAGSSGGVDGPEPMPISRSLDSIMKSLRGTDRIQIGGVFGRWDEAVGEAVAAHVQPVRLDNGVLTVEADEPAWATQVKFLTGTITSRLADVAGVHVERIEVRVARR